MLVKALSRKLFGYIIASLLVATVAGCGGGSGSDPAGSSPQSPIVGNSVIIEARTSGGITKAEVLSTVTLDGTKSIYSSNSPKFTSTNANLSYSWAFTHIPEGSLTTLQNATTSMPSFIADVTGDYIVQLIVSANGLSSKRTVQSILVYDPATPLADKPFGKYPGHFGRSSNCIECHSGDKIYTSTGALIVGKPESHIASSSLCESCHTIRGFDIAVKTDHEEVLGSCSACHNNVTAIGKSEFHSVTESECDACHNTVSFLTLEADGSFDHSNITRACKGCHDGKVARGKAATPIHDEPLSDCGFCHTTDTFKNAYPDHTGPEVVGKLCQSCHNDDPVNGIGKSSTGFHAGDMSIAGDNSLDCNVCHSITDFNMGGSFNHALIDITLDPQEPACYKCHNDSTGNIGATQMPNDANHSSLTTNQDCFLCHTTETFTGATNFDHSGLDPAKRCDDCHGNTAAVSPDVPAIGIPTPTAIYQHVDTNGADCGVCHTPGTFKTGIFDHSTVDLVTTRCDSCHNGVISTGLSSFEDHIPLDSGSPADCDVCHTTTTYESFATPVVMDHTDSGVDISVCGACHDGVKSSGKSVGHVPTRSLDCGDCHVNTSNYTVFTLSPWDHAAIGAGSDTDCASCHAAGYATPKSATHIPSVAECSVCHTNTAVGGFAVNNFRASSHDSLTTGCEGCHVSRFFPDAADANKFKASTHLPTSQDCHFCHSAAATDFTDYSNFSHAGIISNCSSCHDGSFVGVLPNAKGEPNDAIHNTITADCSICHTTVNGFLDGAYVDHASPDVMKVRCDNCHNGDFTSNVPPAPVIKGKNFISNHPATSSDCSVCHASDPAIDFKDGGVDHNSAAVKAQRCDNCHRSGGTATPQSSNHVPIGTDDCGSCHIAGGSFKPSTFNHTGITNNCASCHDGSFVDSGALGKNMGHVTTTADCSSCHNTNQFAGARFDHSTVSASTRCDSCHNGNAAQGKEPPLGHVPTNQDCRACHETTGFIPGTFDHSQNSSSTRCDSCHNTNPGYATPKSSNHIDTTLDCGVCHFGFVSFAGATFDHSGVTASTRCDSCHGVTATGLSANHIETNGVDCRSCHNPDDGTFKGGRWTHDASANGNCTNCHDNGGGATEQPLSHITTSIQCDECHTTSAWTFRHKSPNGAKDSHGYFTMGNYPGDHSISKIPRNRCDLCHTSGFTPSVLPINNSNFTWNEVSSLAPTCSACHQSEARREHGTITSVTNRYANCLVGCHEHSVSKSSW